MGRFVYMESKWKPKYCMLTRYNTIAKSFKIIKSSYEFLDPYPIQACEV